MRIKKIVLHQITIPFKHQFATAQINRTMANNIVIKIETDEHVWGYGECTPRSYVTGEEIDQVISSIKTNFAPYLINRRIETVKEAEIVMSQLSGSVSKGNNFFPGSALCALDLAIFDALGRVHKSSVTKLLGGSPAVCGTYSICMPLFNGDALINALNYLNKYRIQDIKVKVGLNLKDDIERLKIIRQYLGEKIDIRIDANCQWNPQEAIERINIFNKFNISCVEQPVAANDFAGLARVKKNIGPAIIADESACSYEDVRRLIELDACDIINIKLSKCGGLYNSLRIFNLARNAGKACLLGYHIGETGLLEAADLSFAMIAGNLKFLEGGISDILLSENIVHQNIGFDEYGKVNVLPETGLGVTVNEAALNKYTVFREEIN